MLGPITTEGGKSSCLCNCDVQVRENRILQQFASVRVSPDKSSNSNLELQ